MGRRQRKKVRVGDLRGSEQPRKVDALMVKQADIVRPEFVPRMGQQAGHGLDDRGWCSRRPDISRAPCYSNHPILSDRTGGPDAPADPAKPNVRVVVPDMVPIDKGNEYIYVEEKSVHGRSSSSCRTNSVVIFFAPSRVGNSRIPFRVFLAGVEGDNALRASEEITSPTLFRCVSASSFAAMRTSSSIAKVVLTDSSTKRITHIGILHQARDV